ncbi:MAG: cobyrinate a,c-diamide synthase [Pseudomonadota bacterium]
MHGFMIAAPHSGSGKTVVTLGLLRAFRNRGLSVAPAKAGPDYIDPAFHTLAAGSESVNLDPWAMRSGTVQGLAYRWLGGADIAIIEAMMGLFDGAADGTGSAADLAAQLSLPVVLVVDASRMAHSIAALVSGYRAYRNDMNIAGVILNRVGSPRHETMLREALVPINIDVLGAIPSDDRLRLPSRHLGLVQAQEHRDFDAFAEAAAEVVGNNCDLDALSKLTAMMNDSGDVTAIAPLGQKIAIAKDAAFSFLYPHVTYGWRVQGAELSFFSPLANEAPVDDADAVFLPGGYPELHASALANASTFKAAMRDAADRGALIYGECGGYMVLGDTLVDADGQGHEMLGLLSLETSFAQRKRQLGYRNVSPLTDLPWTSNLTAHEFHYSVATREEGDPLFVAWDAKGADLGACGLRDGRVCGSYMHVIDQTQ